MIRYRYLGEFLILQDSRERFSLKISFPNKVSSINIFFDPNRESNPYESEKLQATKFDKRGMSLELSYKFANQKLEFKTEVSGGPIERNFFDIELPAIAPLFVLKVNDQNVLPRISPKEGDLDVTKGISCEKVSLSFSFLGENGQPWIDKTTEETGTKSAILIHGLDPGHLTIFSVCDTPIPGQGIGYEIWIPSVHKPTKLT